MKLWLDDLRPAPEGYQWVKSVNEAISTIIASEQSIERSMNKGREAFLRRDYATRTRCYEAANTVAIEVIDMDHDAGDYAQDGGDYIKLLDWLEAMGWSYPIRIHTMNPVGRANIIRICRHSGFPIME